MSTPYLLIVDDEEDIIEIQEGLLSALGFEQIKTALGVDQAIEVCKDHGHPFLIISDYKMPNGGGARLYHELMALGFSGDFIICSGSPKNEIYRSLPDKIEVIDKIDMITQFREIKLRYISSQSKRQFSRIPIGSLVRLGIIPMDVYLKLGEDKYIKIHREGDFLDSSDSEHFKSKGVENLFVAHEDLDVLVKQFNEFLTEKIQLNDFRDSHDEQEFLTDISSSAVTLASALGITPATYEICKKTVALVYQSLSEDKRYESLFKIREENSEYTKHVLNLSMFLCLCCAKLEWSYEGTFKKFILAAFIHDSDLSLDFYNDISVYENADGSLTDEGKKPEYKNHPARAAQKASEIKGLPSDVVQIILEHHERPDGSGFPRGLFANQISPYSLLFIFCEAVLREHKMGEITRNDLAKFIAHRPHFVEKGALKKMVQQLLKE